MRLPPRTKKRTAVKLTEKMAVMRAFRDRLAVEAREEVEDWCLECFEDGVPYDQIGRWLTDTPEWTPVSAAEVRFRVEAAKTRRRAARHIEHAKANPPKPVPF